MTAVDEEDLAARVRALLKQCCRMCGPGHEHVCDRQRLTPFDAIDTPGRLEPVGPLAPHVQTAMRRLSGQSVTVTNRVRVLRDGADTFAVMLDLIERGETELLLENYIIRNDAIGRTYGEALRQRAREGVGVRVLHDAFGDAFSVLPLHWRFRRSGVRVRVYNPPRPTRAYLRTWRDHRKLLVQDRSRMVAGGLCVADVWLGNCVRQCTWRDSAVLVEGGAAAHAAAAFDDLWQDGIPLTWQPPGIQAGSQSVPPAAGAVPVRILAARPGHRCTEQVLVAALEAAQSEVLITNQYAVPSPPVTTALVAAARRGVHVQLIVPPSPIPFVVGLAMEHRMGSLLDAGIAVWYWTGAMMHAKTVVVDRRWSLVGSTNLDWLSLRRNAEIDIEIHGSRVGEQLADMFTVDRAMCRPFVLEQWQTRTWPRRAVTRVAAYGDQMM